MEDEQQAAVLKRLRSISGHVSGIERMVSEGAYCIDVIKQVQAVQAALNKVNDLILENHLNTCVIEAVRGDNKNTWPLSMTFFEAVFAHIRLRIFAI